MFFKKNKIRYYAWILQNHHGAFHRIGKKKLRATSESFKYKKKPFKVNINLYTFARGLKQYYFFDASNSNQIILSKTKVPNIDSDAYDMVFCKRIVKHLSSNLDKNDWSINLMTFIIGAITGGAIGFIIAGYV